MRDQARRLVAPAAAGVLALASAANAVAPAGSKAYVVNTEGNSVTVATLDAFGAPGSTKAIPLGNLPQGAALDAVHGRLYVANSDDDAIAVIDTVTDALLDVDGTPGPDPSIQLTGFNPTGLAVSPDGSTLYAACQSPGVCVVSGTPLHETSKITLPKLSTQSPIATAVVVHPSGTKIYVIDSQQDVVWPVSVPSNQVGTAIPLTSGGQGRGPSGAALYQNGDRLLVVGDGAPVVIRTSDDTVLTKIGSALGAQIAVAIAGNRAVVANVYNTVVSGGSVDVYDLSNTNAPAVSLNAGGLVNGVTIAPDGSLAWASCHKFGGHGGVAGTPSGVLVQFDPGNVTGAVSKVGIGTGSDGVGPVVGLFTGGAPPPPGGGTTGACVLPARVQLGLKNEKDGTYKGGKDSLFVTGAFDAGDGPVDWSKPVTLEAGALSRQFTLQPNGSGKVWKFNDSTFGISLKPDPNGSSHGTFTAKWSAQTLRGVVDPDESLVLHLRADGLADATGTITLFNRAYVAGNIRGALVAPATFLAAANAKPSDIKPDALSMTVGFTSSGSAPATLAEVRIGVGPDFDMRLPGGGFTRSGDEFRYSSKANGTVVNVLLDFAHGTLTLKTKGIETGLLSGGTTDVVFDPGDGRGSSTVTVTLGSDGPVRTY